MPADNMQTEKFGFSTKNSIPTIIKTFKSVATKRINLLRDNPDLLAWQRNYYEHIIRNDAELNKTREYIINNPANWADDDMNV